MNMVSTFIGYDYHADRNLFDYLQRCDKYGLKVNLSLRPGTPMDFEWDKMREMIEQNRLAQSDTVFAYDLAWEPFLGRQSERTRWDERWSQWIFRHYVTIEAAEQAWGFAVPRNHAGRVTNPFDAHCGSDGPWGKLVADYRRFLDEIVDEHYTRARQLVRSVDPHHLVSFRMTVAGDPTFNQANNMPYDFRGLIRGVDLFEPEGYGRIGDWNQVRPGMFTVAYARAIDPSKPVMWAEYGVSSWDMNLMQTSPSGLDFAGPVLRGLPQDGPAKRSQRRGLLVVSGRIPHEREKRLRHPQPRRHRPPGDRGAPQVRRAAHSPQRHPQDRGVDRVQPG